MPGTLTNIDGNKDLKIVALSYAYKIGTNISKCWKESHKVSQCVTSIYKTIQDATIIVLMIIELWLDFGYYQYLANTYPLYLE